MKHLFLIVFSMPALYCFAQFDRSVSLRANGTFNVALGEPGPGATKGIGLDIDASLFSKHRLQVIAELSIDHFFGIDGIYINNPGKLVRSKNYSIRAGPQFFINKNFAFSATYGPSWYVPSNYHADNVHTDFGFKFGVTGFLRPNRRFIAKVYIVNIPSMNPNMNYLGFGIGYRFW